MEHHKIQKEVPEGQDQTSIVDSKTEDPQWEAE